MTTTPAKGLTQPVVGGDNNTWGGLLNIGLTLIDNALGGTVTKSISGSVALSTTEAQNTGYKFTGTLSGNATITWPPFSGMAAIRNATTGGFSIICGISGATVTVLAGETVAIWSDGTDFVRLAQSGGGAYFATLKPGNQTGSTPWAGLIMERSAGQYSADAGGLWGSSNTAAAFVISELVSAATDPTGTAGPGNLGPRWTLMLDTKTTDSLLGSVSLGITNLGYNAGTYVYGMNIIVGNNNPGVTASLVNGIEIDMAGAGPCDFYSGLDIQLFAGLNATVGARIYGAGTFINGLTTVGGVFSGAAVKLGNQQVLAFNNHAASTNDTAALDASAARILMSVSDQFQITNNSTGGFAIFNNSTYNFLVLSDDVFINRASGKAFRIREGNGSDQLFIATGGAATFGSTINTAGYTVATLPAAGTVGRRAYVTDATGPTFGNTLTGGGSTKVPVFDNGIAWVAG